MKSEQMDDKKALEIWKSKSLNSMPTQSYKISQKTLPLMEDSSTKKKTGKTQPSLEDTTKTILNTSIMPEPKIQKINEAIFCLYLNNELNVFKYMTDRQKIFWKSKNFSFIQITQTVSSNIKFVIGNGNETICVGLEHELIIFKVQWVTEKTQNGIQFQTVKNALKEIDKKNINNLKHAIFIREKNQMERLIALSSDKLYKYDTRDTFNILKQTKLYFWVPEEQKVYAKTKSIRFIEQKPEKLYLFGIIEEERDRMDEKTESIEKKQCETLYLTTVILEGSELGDSVSGKVSAIDHVFQKGIFGKSKVFQLGQSVFLMSLHEEIVVIKQNFEKYVVWDNISLAPSKSQKKGQLVLANKIVMVYTEMGQIYAQNIVFTDQDGQSNLKTPRIDSFKGNDDDQSILYDALVLQYQPGSFMKVLIYFKMIEIFDPSKPNAVPPVKEQKNQADKNKIIMTILCIQQDNPVKKLGELFRNKKQPQEIAQFVERFQIDDLTKSKCEWSVSQKTQKDIETLLLQIKDNQFIQQELTQILKSSPHDLKFLTMIQTKQMQRYLTMLVNRLLKANLKAENTKNSTEPGQLYSQTERDYIKDIIRWYMEAIMFYKKLVYSKNFLQFKEYDFIEIGKLKAASLKQEIKLLSCKGFEKRLQYFMNSFKYMALFNFQDIFTFLIDDKNQIEVTQFFTKNFSFILPNFQEDSQIFQEKFKSKKSIIPYSTILTNIKQDQCQLWVDNIDDPVERAKIQTVESFQRNVIDTLYKQKEPILGLKHPEAQRGFLEILSQFIKEDWFLKNKSKQHSILTTSIDALKNKFQYLKRIGVFHIMIKLFYEKIQKKIYKQENVNQMLETFSSKKKIPVSFFANVKARRKVYDILPPKMNVGKPLLSEFLIYEETKYFKFLFNNYRQILLKEIKNVYDEIQPGFFKQKFKIYLSSSEIDLKQIIDFLDEFEGNANDDIRMNVFTSIKEILKISDRQNTKSFVNKLMDKQILKTDKNSDEQLIDEAKVAFGYYFFNFFEIFNLDYSYKDLIAFTYVQRLQDNIFILTLVEKYCKDTYQHPQRSGFEQFANQSGIEINLDELYGLDQIQNISLQNPSQFFGIMLYIIDTLRINVDSGILFDQIIRLFLEEGRFEEIATFVDEINMIDCQSDQQFNKYRHYLLIDDFKQMNGNDIGERTTNCVIRWIRQKYMSINFMDNSANLRTSLLQDMVTYDSFQDLFSSIKNAMQELQRFLKGISIGRQKQFLSMVIEIKKLYPRLLYNVIPKRYEHFSQQQKNQMKIRSEYSFRTNELQERSQLLTELSGFIFMMRLLKYIIPSRFQQNNIEEINEDLIRFQKIYEHFIYASSFKDLSLKSQKSGYIRFNIELATKLIPYNYFTYTFQVIFKCINTQEYYFRDVFFHFLASISLGNQSTDKLKIFIKEFIGTEAKSIMQRKFKNFINQNGIQAFQADQIRKKSASEAVFVSIIQSHRLDEAFYFLVRNDSFEVSSAKYICQSRFHKKDILAYALISIYLKCLKMHICEQFYPTFEFFKHKHSMLTNQFDRKDIIKDIYIAISKMKEFVANNQIQICNIDKSQAMQILLPDHIKENILKIFQKEEQIKREEQVERQKIRQIWQDKRQQLKVTNERIRPNLKELNELYRFYMIQNGFDPEIKLNQMQLKEASKKLEEIQRFITPDQLQGASNKHIKLFNAQQSFKRERDQQELDLKVKQIKEGNDNKYYQLNKQINQQISDAKKTKQKYERYLQQERQQPDYSQQQKISQYEKLKQREKLEVKSIKDSHKSQASERVIKMVQEMRQRRQQAFLRSQAPSKLSRMSINDQMPASSQTSKYQVKIHGAKGQSNLFMPIMMNKEENKPKISSAYLSGLEQRKEAMKKSTFSQKNHPKQSIEDLINIFKDKQPQCLKYIQKLQFVKNNLQVGIQITKSIYQSVYNFDMFIKYLDYMFKSNPKYKEVIEEKAFKIAQQSLGIEYKIDLKQLFPIELFINIVNIPMKQYYKKAYETLRPNLQKIMKKPDFNVHGLAILFRYGFGSENLYYYCVYEDYIRVLIKDYDKAQIDEKKLFLLAEKLRTLYNNISADTRERKFQQLLREIKDDSKRKILAKQIIKIIDRRSQMLTGQSPSDIRTVVQKLC